MKLYLISQSVNNDWDTYDSAVVVAENETQAKHTSPCIHYVWKDGCWNFVYSEVDVRKDEHSTWCEPEDVQVQYIGEASESTKLGVVLSSFKAG